MGTVFSSIPNIRQTVDLEKEFANCLYQHQTKILHSRKPHISRSVEAPGIIQNASPPGQSQIESLLESAVFLGTSLTAAAPDLNQNHNTQTHHHHHQISNDGHEDSGKDVVTQRPFRAESWPPLDLIKAHLEKRDKYPTTVIFARFHPTRSGKKIVDIEYSVNSTGSEYMFQASDNLETLIPLKEGYSKGDTIEEDIKYFLLILKTCMNNLNGFVWWNGYSILINPHLSQRLQISGLDTGPSQMIFELTKMKELEIHRTPYRTELKGKFDDEEGFRHIRIRGATAKNILVKQLRGNWVTVHIPDFSLDALVY